MTVWKNARMDCFYYDVAADVSYPCEVKIEDSSILVSYDDEGWVVYRGKNDGSGHFELRGEGFDGHASLHMFPGSKILEGYWNEEGNRGMWRIVLA